VPAGTVLDEYINQCTVPHCTVCGSVLKPDVILYEEQLPVNTWLRAEQATKDCGLMLVVGTSLEVLPSARLPVEAMDHGAQLIILNNATTFMDVRADVVIQADVAETLPLIAEQVLKSK
jgi:NAD-dependent deacetylase